MEETKGKRRVIARGKEIEAAIIIKPINRVSIMEKLLDKKDWVKYKTIPEWRSRLLGKEVILSDPGKEFISVVEKNVNAFIFENQDPPAQIATAIMNIADDLLNDREIVLRSGDYISLQEFVRAKR